MEMERTVGKGAEWAKLTALVTQARGACSSSGDSCASSQVSTTVQCAPEMSAVGAPGLELSAVERLG